MKIKRFEAATMSEALRMIKKEFGDEAVILSAKSQKRNKRLFGKTGASQVVVTAAIDKSSDGVSTQAFSTDAGEIPRTMDNTRSTGIKGTFTTGSLFSRFKPITKTGQKILKPKFIEMMDESKSAEKHSALFEKMMERGVNKELAAEWDSQLQELLPSEDEHTADDAIQALSQAIRAKQLIGTHHAHKATQQKCIIMVGPCGAGKTSAVAKMAAKLSLQQTNSVAVLSLDNQRVAGSAELEKFAAIIGVPLQKAFKENEVKAALSKWRDYSHIIIDTPAVSLDDPLQRERLRRQLDLFDTAEHLMVINAAIQEKTMDRMIQYFQPLKIHSLCFTGLDWCVDTGALINLADLRQLPIGFISDSPKIGEALKTATASLLAELLIGTASSKATMSDASVTVITRAKVPHDCYYVANRNSDIFHFHECKSVKRINADNMVVFKDATEAMGQQFKPCRMCCSELIVSQPLNRLARGYAGNRY